MARCAWHLVSHLVCVAGGAEEAALSADPKSKQGNIPGIDQWDALEEEYTRSVN